MFVHWLTCHHLKVNRFNFITSTYTHFTYPVKNFKKELLEKIDFEALEEATHLHAEDKKITNFLNELYLNLESLKSEGLHKFKKYLDTLESGKEYKEPEAAEEKITEKDIIKALKEIGVKDSERVLRKCKKVVDKNKVAIKENYVQCNKETILITSYTHEDQANKTSPYSIINKKLWRDEIQDQLTNKKSYLRLLLRALRKLPRTKPQTLYRGIKWDKHEYKVGEEIEWHGFTSTSTSMRATQTFLKTKENVEKTLFEIRNAWGYDIHDFSDYQEEEGKFI